MQMHYTKLNHLTLARTAAIDAEGGKLKRRPAR